MISSVSITSIRYSTETECGGDAGNIVTRMDTHKAVCNGIPAAGDDVCFSSALSLIRIKSIKSF